MNKDTILHVIKDPVHGTMQFTTIENAWLKPFIDSPHFQRLRHIKQLGMGDYIFPGAVHTRFNHSLGCSYIASQIAHKIGLAEEERQLAMLSSLLHDIGHGPFSHTFEDLFHNKLIRHEDWTPFFLNDYRNEAFFSHYNQVNRRHHLTEEKFILIAEMIMHQSKVKRVLADIVSSQLDADRLDYLLRDSHFCGVAYGEFDLSWMLNSMCIVTSDDGERLGLTHKGIGVVEHYLMARRLMTRNIYFHPKKLALEFFLIKLLARVAVEINTDPTLHSIKNTRLGNFLIAVNQFNQNHLDKKEFLETNYPIYKDLCDYDVYIFIKSLAQLSTQTTIRDLAKRLHDRIMPKIIRLDHIDLNKAEEILDNFKSEQNTLIEDWQIQLIKTPHQSYRIDEDPILILHENGTIKPLNETSLMISAISDRLEHSAFLCIDKPIYQNGAVSELIKKLATCLEPSQQNNLRFDVSI